MGKWYEFEAPSILKKGLAVVLTLGALFGAWYAIDRFGTTFARAEETDKKIEAVAGSVEKAKDDIAQQTIQAFQAYETKQNTINNTMRLQILNIQYEDLTDRYYKTKRQLAETPDDLELKAEFEELLRKRSLIENKRQEVIENTLNGTPVIITPLPAGGGTQ